MLDEEVIKAIDESVLCWLATVNGKGEPNVSPKEMFIAHGDRHILIANIASPQSVGNIQSNYNVCVSFVDVFKQKGYKIRGVADVIEKNNPGYAAREKTLRTVGAEKFDFKSIIEVQVESVEPILAPSYIFFPETSEESQIRDAMRRYGVKPLLS